MSGVLPSSIKTQPYQSSGSQSLNPLAKGLLAIFNCVICKEKWQNVSKQHMGLPGQTVSVSLSRLWDSAVLGVTERVQVAGGATVFSATEHKNILSLC